MSAIIRAMGQLQIDFENTDREVDILCICSGLNAKRKCEFEAYAERESPDQTARVQSDQGLHCPFPELLDCTNHVTSREQKPYRLEL